jgi:hypothetical protein
MARRFQFSTRRLLLATAVVAVWSAVLLNACHFLPSVNSESPLFTTAAIICFFALPTVFLMWLAAVSKTAGVWLNLRSLRSKLCLTPSVGGFRMSC